MTVPFQDLQTEIAQEFLKILHSELQSAKRDDEANAARRAQVRPVDQPDAPSVDPGPGRPRAIDDQVQKAFCNLLLDGFSQRRSARLLGVNIRTVQLEKKRNPDFAALIDNALRQREANALRFVREAGRKSWRAATWLLERSCPAAYAPRQARRSSARLNPQLLKQIESLIDKKFQNHRAADLVTNRIAHLNGHAQSVSNGSSHNQ